MALTETYQEFINFFPGYIGTYLNLLILVLIVVVYAIFIWKFDKFISRKNIIGLNLNKYNTSENPFSTKLLAGALYFLEYIIIVPFIIFIIYFVFSLFLIIFATEHDASQIMVISAIVIVAIRITAYYKESLSEDIAKLLPFNLLAVAILSSLTFSQTQYFGKVIENFSQLPSLLGEASSYFIFIVILEVILRFFDFLFSLFGLEEIDEEKIN